MPQVILLHSPQVGDDIAVQIGTLTSALSANGRMSSSMSRERHVVVDAHMLRMKEAAAVAVIGRPP